MSKPQTEHVASATANQQQTSDRGFLGICKSEVSRLNQTQTDSAISDSNRLSIPRHDAFNEIYEISYIIKLYPYNSLYMFYIVLQVLQARFFEAPRHLLHCFQLQHSFSINPAAQWSFIQRLGSKCELKWGWIEDRPLKALADSGRASTFQCQNVSKCVKKSVVEVLEVLEPWKCS